MIYWHLKKNGHSVLCGKMRSYAGRHITFASRVHVSLFCSRFCSRDDERVTVFFREHFHLAFISPADGLRAERFPTLGRPVRRSKKCWLPDSALVRGQHREPSSSAPPRRSISPRGPGFPTDVLFVECIFCELEAHGSAITEPECEDRLGQPGAFKLATENDAETPRHFVSDVRASEDMSPGSNVLDPAD